MRGILRGWLLPLLLATAGVVLIIVGQLEGDGTAVPSLPPIEDPTPTEVAQASPTPTPAATPDASPQPTAEPTAEPTPTPLPDDVVAVQLEVETVGINVAVRQSPGGGIESFPPSDAAYILSASAQPGRNTNSYLFAHAINALFKPLWNVQLGAEVKVLMSDGTVLRYRVTEVRPNVPCPDTSATTNNPPNPPLALRYATSCDEGVWWTQPTDHERLTLQTSQGFNRNWGELVIVALPVDR